MKLITSICFLVLIGTSSIAQESETVSNLRLKVDSIIRYQIEYVKDSTTNVKPVHNRNSKDPKTKIILNGLAVRPESLNQYNLKEVEEIKVFPKENDTAMALYGSSARNGLILIRLKK